MRDITAVDYSRVIIQSMNERTQTKKLSSYIRYKEEDLFDIRSEKPNSFDLIIDKGTLDAISSDNTNQTKTVRIL